MKSLRPSVCSCTWHLVAWLWILGTGLASFAQTPLTNIAEIRELPREVAARHLPVKVTGIITIGSTVKTDFFFIQTEGQGTQAQAIGVSIAQATAEGLQPIEDGRPDYRRPGYLVEVEGVTGSGDFTPVILPKRIVNLGRRELPPVVVPTFAELLTGVYDCQRVGMRGVVQRVEKRAGTEPVRLILAAERGGYLAVDALDATGLDTNLLDAWVFVQGPVLTFYNNRGELLGVRLIITDRGDVTVMRPPPPDPFATPLVSLEKIGAFSPTPPSQHRQRIQGVVTLSRPGEYFYLQAGARAVRVTTSQSNGPAVGDQIEAAGFVTVARQYAELREAVFRKMGTAMLPPPVEVTWKMVLQAVGASRKLEIRDFDGRLVSLRGRLESIEEVPDQPLRIRLSHEGRIIIATFGKEVSSAMVQNLRPGSEVLVHGICVMSFNATWPVMEGIRPSGFRLLLKSPADVVVLKGASWWTPVRLAYALTGTVSVLVLTLLWVWLLRRAVQKQAQRVVAEQRAKHDAAVEFKATLRERNRLAADLHDTLEQGLTAVALQLETARVLRVDQPAEAVKRTEFAYELLDRSRDDLRRSVWSLRVGILEGRAFEDALQELTSRTERTYGVACSSRLDTDSTRVPEFEASHLLLVAQEAVTNALKHASPKAITITGQIEFRKVTLVIIDDGCGFDPEHAPGPKEGHFGLLGMKERLHAMSGALHVTSATGQGTRVEVSIPLTPS
jgi:signal transduction histidine kinase